MRKLLFCGLVLALLLSMASVVYAGLTWDDPEVDIGEGYTAHLIFAYDDEVVEVDDDDGAYFDSYGLNEKKVWAKGCVEFEVDDLDGDRTTVIVQVLITRTEPDGEEIEIAFKEKTKRIKKDKTVCVKAKAKLKKEK